MRSLREAAMKMTRTAAAIAGLAAVLIAAPAFAGTKDDVRDLQARMERAEQALSAQSAATVKISELERQIQLLTGRLEELDYQLDQQNRRLDSISAVLAGGDLSGAGGVDGLGAGGLVGPIGAGRSGGPVALGPSDPIADELARADTGAAPSVELPINPDAAYDYASSFLLSGDYPRAKAAFMLYGEAFPNHVRAADAKFRLGEIHLALGEDADAAAVFLEHVQKYPNDARAAEAHLKLGTAFARMEKQREACTIFKTMKSKFPNAASPVMQRADLEMARIDCN